MPKKKISGKTKLNPEMSPGVDDSKESLHLLERKEKTYPTSHRLKESDIQRLKSIVKNVNDASSSTRISETNVVRALILIGENTKPEKIIKAYKQLL
jgi:hypothetical protein